MSQEPELIPSGEKADYIELDLGTGREWLTSRLYLLSAHIPEVSGVQRLVFVETRAGLPRQFAGVAHPA